MLLVINYSLAATIILAILGAVAEVIGRDNLVLLGVAVIAIFLAYKIIRGFFGYWNSYERSIKKRRRRNKRYLRRMERSAKHKRVTDDVPINSWNYGMNYGNMDSIKRAQEAERRRIQEEHLEAMRDLDRINDEIRHTLEMGELQRIRYELERANNKH